MVFDSLDLELSEHLNVFVIMKYLFKFCFVILNNLRIYQRTFSRILVAHWFS